MQLSRLLLGALVAAVAATGAFLVILHIGLLSTPPPPTSLVLLPVVTGLFVLAWLAVLVVFARDQILRRIEQLRAGPATGTQPVGQLIGELRAQLAADRERELQVLERRITELTQEYGEQRETDGYLTAMRMATGEEAVPANVHSIHRTPPR